MPRYKQTAGGTVQVDLGTLNPKQKQFCQSRSRYTAYGGARGGGKTRSAAEGSRRRAHLPRHQDPDRAPGVPGIGAEHHPAHAKADPVGGGQLQRQYADDVLLQRQHYLSAAT